MQIDPSKDVVVVDDVSHRIANLLESDAAANLAKQQRQLDLFQYRYNYERPHEALDADFPAERWQPSTKEYSGRLRKPEYPGHCEVRTVSSCGTFRLSGQYFPSKALAGEDIGLGEVPSLPT